jgi:hypothetical protein
MTIYNPEFFKKTEFYNFDLMNPLFLFAYDLLRAKLGEYIKCAFHNISTNEPHHKHATNSKHYQNSAVDFYITFKSSIIKINNKYIANLVYCALHNLTFTNKCGFGIYINDKGYMSFHFDLREVSAKWMALSKDEKGNWIYTTFDIEKIIN